MRPSDYLNADQLASLGGPDAPPLSPLMEIDRLRRALHLALWRPYLADRTRLVCRECGMSKGHGHDPICEFAGLDDLAADDR